MSFRRRLLLASLATLAVGLGALVVAGNVLLNVRVHDEASTLLRARVDTELATLELGGGRLRVRETPDDEVLDREAWVIADDRLIERPESSRASLDAKAVALGTSGRTIEREVADDIRMRAVPVRDGGRVVGAVVASVSVAPLERLQKEVLLGSLVISALVLLAGAVALRSAVGGALRPVAEMTAAADSWGAEDLDRRFALGPAQDELTGLAHTLDGLLARIAASRRHEQRFAAEIAHELRTPLARLRGRAELALRQRGPGGDAARATALAAVVSEVTRLDAAVTALLAVARRELDPSEGTVDLAALAEELARSDEVGALTGELVRSDEAGAAGAAEHVALAVLGGPVPAAEGEPEVVRRALAPLVENARRHARARVVLELSAAGGQVRVAVRDDGPGVPPRLGETVFEPGVRGAGSDGGGLGLPLARRLARSCGGDVTLGPGPGGDFVLTLPELGRR